MRLILAGVLALATSACSATVYKTEVEAMVAAGRVVAAAPAGYQDAQRQMNAADHRTTLTFDALRGGAISAGPSCTSGPLALVGRYRDAAPADAAERDAVFEAFADQPTCDFDTGGNAGDDYKPGALEVALTEQMNTYLSALEAIVKGDTIAEVDQALTEARAAGRALAEATPGGARVAAASDLAFTLLSFDLEQRRYAALRNAVTAVDPAWRAAAPDIEDSLRIHHLSLIRDRSALANRTRARMATLLNGHEWPGSPLVRLEAFDRLDATLTEQNAALRAALDADPGKTVRAFTKAHGKLLAALNDPSRQTAGVLEAVSELVRDARALDAALDGDAE